MDPSTIQNTISPMTPEGLNTPPQVTSKPKNHKATIWALSILAIIALAAAGVFAYLYFTNQNPTPETVVKNDEDTPEPTEEVEITDTYTLRDLDEKIAILHDTSETGPTIGKGTVVGGYSDNILNMYKNGYLDPLSIQVAYVINAIKPQFRHLNAAEREAVISMVQPEYREELQNVILWGIDGDLVASKYQDVFGKELARETSDNCYTYKYDSTYDFYYQNPIGGCGGTSPYKTSHYKNKYTVAGNNAYVYMYVALSDAETNNVYCDVAFLNTSGPFDLSSDAKVCAPLPADGSFTLNESNYQDFTEYRFVFNKADNGTYYFEKVEKL